MLDRNTFMETLHSVQEIARTSETPMDRESALAYFKDMELTEEQKELVYQFLLLPPEELEAAEELEDTADAAEETEAVESSDTTAEQAGNAETVSEEEEEHTHFQMYLDEVEEITELEAETEASMYQALLKGDAEVIGALCTQWLRRVITIAEDYKDKGFLLDDLVQEGNMGLLMELHEMLGTQTDVTVIDLSEITRRLRDAVKNTIELYMGEESGEDQQSETILAKVSLVHEAQKLMTEEKGEAPSLRQLAEYTRIPEDEISDILSLIKKK